jgi:hypothetical protein
MSKRGLYSEENSIYIAPPLESTLLVDTGGLENTNPIGYQPSTDISAALSSGARKFQYNRFFWSNELFTFNYQNGSIGIAVIFYNTVTQRYFFGIYPISLPRVALTLLASLNTNPSSTPSERLTLLKQFVYYLNIGFTSYGVGNVANYHNGSTFNRGPPIILASDCKGIVCDYTTKAALTVDNPDFPLFSDIGPTPLVWDILSSNQQICLRANPAYWSTPTNLVMAFNVISLCDFMGIAPLVSLDNLIRPILFSADSNFYVPSALNEPQGWCCQGAFATGFTQNIDYNNQYFQYSDVYTSNQRFALFQATVFPCAFTHTMSFSDFILFCDQHQLHLMNQNSVIPAKFITSLIPSRFITIESNAISRNQKRPFVSNNPNINSATMALQFITMDARRSYQDSTISGSIVQNSTSSTGFRKIGVDDASVISMDPMQSCQILDLTLKDEWGNILQNYNQLSNHYDDPTATSSPPMSIGQVVYFFIDGAGQPPNFMPVAPWAATYNPVTVGGNTESPLINESWWCSFITLFLYNPSLGPPTVFMPPTFKPHVPQASTITHFGRVLGY